MIKMNIAWMFIYLFFFTGNILSKIDMCTLDQRTSERSSNKRIILTPLTTTDGKWPGQYEWISVFVFNSIDPHLRYIGYMYDFLIDCTIISMHIHTTVPYCYKVPTIRSQFKNQLVAHIFLSTRERSYFSWWMRGQSMRFVLCLSLWFSHSRTYWFPHPMILPRQHSHYLLSFVSVVTHCGTYFIFFFTLNVHVALWTLNAYLYLCSKKDRYFLWSYSIISFQ